jgi:DNA-binding IclR family transcriptional regulator
MPADRIDRLFTGAVLRRVTPHTAVTLTQLHTQLASDRAAGLAWSDGNFEAGISSVAAPIFDATDMPVAALNVSGHAADFAGPARRTLISDNMKAAAVEISQRLGWRGTQLPVAGGTPAKNARRRARETA